jgi:hypothetical protein
MNAHPLIHSRGLRSGCVGLRGAASRRLLRLPGRLLGRLACCSETVKPPIQTSSRTPWPLPKWLVIQTSQADCISTHPSRECIHRMCMSEHRTLMEKANLEVWLV